MTSLLESYSFEHASLVKIGVRVCKIFLNSMYVYFIVSIKRGYFAKKRPSHSLRTYLQIRRLCIIDSEIFLEYAVILFQLKIKTSTPPDFKKKTNFKTMNEVGFESDDYPGRDLIPSSGFALVSRFGINFLNLPKRRVPRPPKL